MQRMAIAATLIAGIFMADAGAQEGVLLRYRLKKGDRFTTHKVETVKQDQTIKDKKLSFEFKTTTDSDWSVTNVDAKGNATLRIETKRLQMKVNFGPLGKYEYDSAKEENDKASALGAAMTPALDSLSGAIIEVVISPRGKVIRVKGFDEVLKTVAKNNPFAQQLLAGMKDEAKKASFANLFPQFPEKRVQPLDMWNAPYEVKLANLGDIKGKVLFTFDGKSKLDKRPTYKLTVTHELNIDLNINQGAAVVKGNLSLTDSSGTAYVDPMTGLPLSLASKQTMTGNMTVSVAGMMIPMTMTQTQSVTHRLTRVKSSPPKQRR